MLWALHRLWVNTVIAHENRFLEGTPIKPLNSHVGKGMVFCAVVEETTTEEE